MNVQLRSCRIFLLFPLDFLFGFLVQPLFITFRIFELLRQSELVCRLRTALAMAAKICVGASLSHTCLISVERYLAVNFVAPYNVLLTKRRTVVAVSLLWLISTVYSVLPFVGLPEVGNFTGLTALVARFVVVNAGCYIGTFAELGAKSARLNNHREARVAPANVPCQNPTEVPGQLSTAASLRKKKEKKLAETLLITVGILGFCYLPGILAYALLPQKRDEMERNWIVQRWCDTSFYLNSFVNPFWYCWRIVHLRRAVQKLLGFRER